MQEQYFEGKMLSIWVDTLLIRFNVCALSFRCSVVVTEKTSVFVTWVPIHRCLSLKYSLRKRVLSHNLSVHWILTSY